MTDKVDGSAPPNRLPTERIGDDLPPAFVYEDAAKALLANHDWDTAASLAAADEERWQRLIGEAASNPGLRAIVEAVWLNRTPTADAYRAADAAYHRRLDQAKALAAILRQVRSTVADTVDIEALRTALAPAEELLDEVGGER